MPYNFRFRCRFFSLFLFFFFVNAFLFHYAAIILWFFFLRIFRISFSKFGNWDIRAIHLLFCCRKKKMKVFARNAKCFQIQTFDLRIIIIKIIDTWIIDLTMPIALFSLFIFYLFFFSFSLSSLHNFSHLSLTRPQSKNPQNSRGTLNNE